MPATLLRAMLDTAVAAQPLYCVPPNLPKAPNGRVVVISAGKASAAMARAVKDHWSAQLAGCDCYGCAVPCRGIEIFDASHPVPDAAGM